MKKGIKKYLLAVFFLSFGSFGYALSAYSVTTKGVVVFTTGSSTESSTSGSTTESTTNDAQTKDSTEDYPETGENVGTSLFLRSLGLVILAIVAAVAVRKIPTKK